VIFLACLDLVQKQMNLENYKTNTRNCN